jgi:hypothetical protein
MVYSMSGMPPPRLGVSASDQAVDLRTKVGRMMRWGRHDDGASCHYEKTPVSQGKSGVYEAFSRVRAEGFEPSTQGLKVQDHTEEPRRDSDMLHR